MQITEYKTEYKNDRERLIEVIEAATMQECQVLLAKLSRKRFGDPNVKKITIHLDIGRNDLCPCGSRRKFKKCCINK